MFLNQINQAEIFNVFTYMWSFFLTYEFLSNIKYLYFKTPTEDSAWPASAISLGTQ